MYKIKFKIITLFVILSLCLAACGKQDTWKNESDICITDEAALSLSGSYKKLATLQSNGDVTLDGKFPELESVELEKTGDGNMPVLTLSSDSEFGELRELFCGAIELKGTELSAEQFPSLERVDIQIPNQQWDERIAEDLEVFYNMYQDGSLSDFSLEVTHSIEDLYGSWTDENGLLGFAFSENGSVRVSDSTGLIGADLLTFTEVDNSTLRLQADTSSWLDILSFEMKYQLLGDTMTVWILGQEFDMVR